MQELKPIARWQAGLSTMRKPRPEAFDPKAKVRTPDRIDMSGVVPLVPPSVKDIPVSTAQQQEALSTPGVVSRYHDTKPASPLSDSPFFDTSDVAQLVRKAVKEFGKEAATYRFTTAEKKALADIIYDYRRQGVRTSENEITRIAINYMFYDYQRHKERSLLHQLLTALNE